MRGGGVVRRARAGGRTAVADQRVPTRSRCCCCSRGRLAGPAPWAGRCCCPSLGAAAHDQLTAAAAAAGPGTHHLIVDGVLGGVTHAAGTGIQIVDEQGAHLALLDLVGRLTVALADQLGGLTGVAGLQLTCGARWGGAGRASADQPRAGKESRGSAEAVGRRVQSAAEVGLPSQGGGGGAPWVGSWLTGRHDDGADDHLLVCQGALEGLTLQGEGRRTM